MDDKLNDDLEQALVDLLAGRELTRVITANPNLEVEIETAQLVQSLSLAKVPSAVVHRSRTRVLSRAMQLRQTAQPKSGTFRQIPRIIYALVLALIFLLSWNGLVFASGQALPGDQLYPAKLTLEKLRLSLALNPQTHQKVEEEYQARRIDEVTGLLALGRVEFVQFFGVVEQQWEDHWIIDGIEVRLLPETIILGDILPGMTVEVEGATQPEGWVQASEIHLQDFSFTGIVETISKTVWRISGREVLITPASQIDSDIRVGDTVIVEVGSDDFGNLTARLITRYALKGDDLQAAETPRPPGDAQDESDDTLELEEGRGDDETGEEDDSKEESKTSEPDEPEETDKPDEPDETEEPDETDDPDESDETEEPDETDDPDEPDETEEPDETDDPDETDEPND